MVRKRLKPSGMGICQEDELRTARLLFDAELCAGMLNESTLRRREVQAATRIRHIPSRPVRLIQQVLYKLARARVEAMLREPLLAARASVLGERASAPPRFLVRVDEFPHYRAWDDPQRFGTSTFLRFNEIMVGAGVPYLLAVLPRISHEPLLPSDFGSRGLSSEEVSTIHRVVTSGVTLALHGYDHRTRNASPRRSSELCGLSAAETDQLLDRALAELEAHGLAPNIFVPPYNRFDDAQLQLLARRFEIVCGGPESVGTLGLQRTPQWRGEAVYLPSYAPFYGHAREVLPAARRAIQLSTGIWTPIVLHWGWEAEAGWSDLERLVTLIAPHAVGWEDFLAAVRRSR